MPIPCSDARSRADTSAGIVRAAERFLLLAERRLVRRGGYVRVNSGRDLSALDTSKMKKESASAPCGCAVDAEAKTSITGLIQ